MPRNGYLELSDVAGNEDSEGSLKQNLVQYLGCGKDRGR
jgi:hypothetical protein